MRVHPSFLHTRRRRLRRAALVCTAALLLCSIMLRAGMAFQPSRKATVLQEQPAQMSEVVHQPFEQTAGVPQPEGQAVQETAQTQETLAPPLPAAQVSDEIAATDDAAKAEVNVEAKAEAAGDTAPRHSGKSEQSDGRAEAAGVQAAAEAAAADSNPEEEGKKRLPGYVKLKGSAVVYGVNEHGKFQVVDRKRPPQTAENVKTHPSAVPQTGAAPVDSNPAAAKPRGADENNSASGRQPQADRS